jgi:transglutaminase-like putative cysteine protease
VTEPRRSRDLVRLLTAEIVASTPTATAGALGFGRVFDGASYLLPVAGAAVAGVVLAAVSAVRRFSLSGSLLLSVLGFVAYTSYAVLGHTAPNVVPTLATFRQLGEGLTGAWADLLTRNLPTEAEPRLLVLAVALTWFPAALGVHLAVRARNVAAPVLPTLAGYVLVLGFAASQPRQPWGYPAAMAALVLIVVLLHTNRWAALEPAGVRVRRVDHSAPEPTVERAAHRWVAMGLPIIAVAVLAGLVVTATTPDRPGAFDPRSLRSQQVSRTAAENPLAGLKQRLVRDSSEPVFRLQTAGVGDALAVDRVRLAVLDSYDGAAWSSSSRYTRAGTELPAGPEVTVPQRTVRQRFTVEAGLPGPWLPAADRPVEVNAPDGSATFGVDDATGTLILDAGDARGLTYEVTSLVPQYDEATLETLPPARSEDARAAVLLPDGLPQQIADLAVRYTDGANSPYGKLHALEEALRSGYGYNDGVPSGSSYGRLSSFLTERTGYAEQFATLFAVMARSLGYPARLSYGYLTVTNRGTAEAEVLTEITDRQAHVWPEVWLEGAGWVPFEPTPARVESSPPEARESPAVAIGGTAFAESDTGGAAGSAASANDTLRRDAPLLSTPILVVLVLVTAGLMLLVVLLVAKALRRHRRRRAHQSTVLQVLGAWADVTDRLLELGVPVQRSMTAKEVVAISADRVAVEARERLESMAPIVTVALFAPVSPTMEGAQEMWLHADAFRREVLRGQPWYQAVFAYVNPRPLFGSMAAERNGS